MAKNKRDAALKAMETALREIAARNEYPPSPGDYLAIKVTWRNMVRTARRAVKKLDDLGENDL